MILLLKDLYGGKVPKGSTLNAVPCPPEKEHLRHLTWIHPKGFEPIFLLPSDYDIALPKKQTAVADVNLPIKGTSHDLPSVTPIPNTNGETN